MDEKKIKNTGDAQQLTDKEVEDVNGGMKIVIFEQPSLLKRILRLIFKVKDTDD